MLFDAMERTLRAEIASAMLIVDAKNERAAAFYERCGFFSFGPRRSKLYLTLKEIRRIFSMR